MFVGVCAHMCLQVPCECVRIGVYKHMRAGGLENVRYDVRVRYDVLQCVEHVLQCVSGASSL